MRAHSIDQRPLKNTTPFLRPGVQWFEGQSPWWLGGYSSTLDQWTKHKITPLTAASSVIYSLPFFVLSPLLHYYSLQTLLYYFFFAFLLKFPPILLSPRISDLDNSFHSDNTHIPFFIAIFFFRGNRTGQS
jgi:hypothetical protein